MRTPNHHKTAIETIVASRTIEAEGIVSLELSAAEGHSLPPFEAGAHVDLHLPNGLTRPYSLCNDPSQYGRYRLGILLDPMSRGGSRSAHQQLKVGDRVKIGHPRNNFPLRENAAHSVLLAGGIGITPLLGMSLRLHSLQRSFELHYATRSAARTAFRDELAASPFADRVRLYFDDCPNNGQLSLESVLADPNTGKQLYVCGPRGFIEYVTTSARLCGWQPEQIHLEHFTADVRSSDAPFTVICARSGVSVVVESDQTIATALMQVGVHVAVACEVGICGTCLKTILDGIPDHRDLFLSDKAKAVNNCLTLCCSRSKTATITIDL